MKNKMFNMYGQRQPQRPNFQNERFDNMNQFFDRFNQFKQQFSGNPDEKLQEMLNSGQMRQEQYDKLYQLARKITGR